MNPTPAKRPPSAALILFAHGARDPEWAAPLRRVQAAIQAAQPGLPVELAFLELLPPDLPDCVAALARQGIGRITVVPMFIAQGSHLRRDLPVLLDDLRRRWPTIELTLTAAIGEHPEVVAVMARAAASGLDGAVP
ncbi:MAG: CbiX/SirB N-terminal domain-containing protein [Azonexus sp.]|nr:CbiX/SirB N-terminal domain-containing protein [Azonexus sp.]